MLKPNNLVVYNEPSNSVFDYNEVVLFLGEIENMKGHGIFVKRNGKLFWGYHIDNFRTSGYEEI